MTALEIYRAQFEEERSRYNPEWSKYKWVAEKVFDLTTYDDDLDERFAKDILEVCKVILENRNFDYIKTENNYVKYILVCQLLNDRRWLEWGSSIRGAWFEEDWRQPWPEPELKCFSKDILEELEWWDSEHHIIEKVPFTVDNLKALIEFMEE